MTQWWTKQVTSLQPWMWRHQQCFCQWGYLGIEKIDSIELSAVLSGGFPIFYVTETAKMCLFSPLKSSQCYNFTQLFSVIGNRPVYHQAVCDVTQCVTKIRDHTSGYRRPHTAVLTSTLTQKLWCNTVVIDNWYPNKNFSDKIKAFIIFCLPNLMVVEKMKTNDFTSKAPKKKQ